MLNFVRNFSEPMVFRWRSLCQLSPPSRDGDQEAGIIPGLLVIWVAAGATFLSSH